jgi:hypothetical protein
VGTRWRTRGSSPRSLGGVWHSFKVLFTVSSLCEAFISAGLSDISVGLGGAVRMCRGLRVLGARDGEGGWGARCLQLPSSGSRIAGSSPSCYQVVQVDAHAPFDKGRLVVRRLVHESAYAGVLGRARSRSPGTEGAEALPRWDPSTSYPRWFLNMTCGAPLSWCARGQARVRAPSSSLTLLIWGACSNTSRVKLRTPDQ